MGRLLFGSSSTWSWPNGMSKVNVKEIRENERCLLVTWGVGSESMTGCKKSGFDFGVVSAELQQH